MILQPIKYKNMREIFNIGRSLMPEKITIKKIEKDTFPIAKYLNIGYHLVSPIVGGVFFGLYLDTKLKTRPVMLLVFLLLGVVLSFYSLIKISKEIK